MVKRYSFGWVDLRETYGAVHDVVRDELVFADGSRMPAAEVRAMPRERLEEIAQKMSANRSSGSGAGGTGGTWKLIEPVATPVQQPTSIAPAVPPKIKAPEIDL